MPIRGSATGRCGSTSDKLDLKCQSAEHPSKIHINSSVGNQASLHVALTATCATVRY